jgi:16S rRNA (guanine966-N2)-methyltransferase
VIRANVATLGLDPVCRVAAAKVSTVLATGPDEPYDIVFADPPYDVTNTELAPALNQLVAGAWLAAGGVLVVERSTRSAEPPWPGDVTLERSRRYGESTLWYGRRA